MRSDTDLQAPASGRTRSPSAPSRRVPRARRALPALVAVAVAGTLCACSGNQAAPSRPTHYPQAVQQVAVGDGAVHLVLASTAPAVPPAALVEELASDEAGFSTALVRELYEEGTDDSNVLASPLSAAVAISMLELGARGSTEAGIAKALQSSELSAADDAEGWAGLLAGLGTDLGPVKLDIADSAWMQEGVAFETSYLQSLARDYGDAAYQADFAGHMPAAVAAINQWVSAATGGRITHLLSPGALAPATIFVLANALHFRAQWASAIGSPENVTESFDTAAWAGVTVPAVDIDASLRTELAAGYTAVEVPYAGGRFSALVVEPSGSMRSFLASLSAGQIDSIVSTLGPERVELTMPTLSLSDNLSMQPTLTGLGMGEAFAADADLSGISAEASSVGDVIQGNRLVVSAWGTDFASATVVGVAGAVAEVPPPVRVDIDRPYLFLIRDDSTGTIVATAVVNNPAAGA
jgi:serpin B